MAEAGVVLACIVLAKLAWLAADHTLRVYMGDSMVYLQSAATLSVSGGRSFLYGWVLHFVAHPFGSPLSILVAQALWSALSCLALFLFLRLALALGPWLSAAPALLLSSEPAQVFMERMVMAETIGLLAFVATLLVLSRYLHTARLGWYLLACLGGLAAANFRTSLLPVVIGLAALAPFLPFAGGKAAPGRPRWAHAALALAVLAASHLAYTHAYGYATKHPPGYLAYTGMMRIGLVAPLIRPEHFEGTGVSGALLDEVRRPLDDHWQRGHHIWEADGLWETLKRHSDAPEQVARTVTRRAMLDDPLGLLAINLETLGGYFDRHRVRWRMLDDKGVIAPTAEEHEQIEAWMGWNVRGADRLETPARRYFAAATGWLTACLFLLAPLAVATAWLAVRHPARVQYWLLALASMGLVASHLLFAHIVSFRYLHPFPWFAMANAAAIIGLVRFRNAARPSRPGAPDRRASSSPAARG